MKYLFTVILCTICAITNAQLSEFGLKLGISNTSYLLESKNSNFQYDGKYAQSIYAFFYSKVYAYKNVSVNAGIGFIEKVSLIPYKVAVTGTDSVTINQYETLPTGILGLDFKINLPVDFKKPIYPYLLAGPQLHFNDGRFRGSNLNNIRSTQFQLIVGAGIDFNIRKLNMFLEAQRFLQMNSNISSISSADLSIMEKSMVFSLGFKYLISKKA